MRATFDVSASTVQSVENDSEISRQYAPAIVKNATYEVQSPSIRARDAFLGRREYLSLPCADSSGLATGDKQS